MATFDESFNARPQGYAVDGNERMGASGDVGVLADEIVDLAMRKILDLTAVSNLSGKGDVDLTNPAWIEAAAGTPTVLDSTGAVNNYTQPTAGRIRTGTAASINGNTYLYAARVRTTNALTSEGAYNFVRTGFLLSAVYQQSIDMKADGGEAGGFVRDSFSTISLRFLGDGTDHLIDLQSLPENEIDLFVEYEFVALYDVTGITGLAQDTTTGFLIDFSKELVVWGDSVPALLTRDLKQLLNVGATYPENLGGDTSTQTRTKFDAKPELHSKNTIIWTGHNNAQDEPAVVIADIDYMVGQLTGDYRLPLLNITATLTPGTQPYLNVIVVNDHLIATYPNKILDVYQYLADNGNEGGQDQTDIDNGFYPSSCRVDSIHLNIKGDSLVSDFIEQSVGSNWIGVGR